MCTVLYTIVYSTKYTIPRVSCKNIYSTSYGEVINFENKDIRLYCKYTSWLSNYQYIFINSKFNIMGRYVSLTVEDFNLIKDKEQSYSCKTQNTYIKILLKKYSCNLKNMVEQDDLSFCFSNSPFDEITHYSLYGIEVKLTKTSAFFSCPYENLILLLHMTFFYNHFYETEDIKTKWKFNKKITDVDFFFILEEYLKNPTTYVNVQISNLEDEWIAKPIIEILIQDKESASLIKFIK